MAEASTLRIVSVKGPKIKISGKWGGKDATYFIDKKRIGPRGMIRLLNAKGESAGNLGPHRVKDGSAPCPHYVKLLKLLYG